jgi:hypothetical protein
VTPAAVAEVLSRAYAARGAPPPLASSPSAPPPAVLEAQIPPGGEADRRWLEERLRLRFGGLEDLGPAIPAERWCVTVRHLTTKPVPWTGGKTEERLVREWFFGPDPAAALAKARAWVEDQRRRAP